ncbi:hypothetical protein J3R30DRAFT_618844 [Lentinula aciculospora]|uniref:Uncharacterized protein n=1 Tax=Lentinula aciculospora TaxID=153920 RepID=A0A9W9DLP2_9AGAR|nr:hypothetical protein J3R30DRAFT_618844 [Lentinula aciculospora]
MKFILYTPDSEANVSYPSSKSRTYYYRYPHARHSSWLLMTIFQLVLLATIVGLCVASPVPVSGSTKKNFLNRLDRYLDNYGVARKSQLTVLIGYTWIASEIIPLKPVFPSDLDTTSSTIANVARLAIAPNTNLILHEHSPRNGLETVLKNLAALIEKLKVAGQLNYMYVFPSAIYFREMVPEGSTLVNIYFETPL